LEELAVHPSLIYASTLDQPKGCCFNCTTACSLIGQRKSRNPKISVIREKTSLDWLCKRIERARMWKTVFELNIEGTK
jgi:hypothetical protein